VCDLAAPGQLKLELSEEVEPGRPFTRLRGDYRPALSPVEAKPLYRQHRRFVIA
jgi:hypothetical protein